MTRTSTINALIERLHTALHRLGKPVSMAEAEGLATRIHRAMDSPNRAYHTSRHVLDVCTGDSPLADLAALYHDVAYYQLDGGFPAHMGDWPARFIERRDNDFVLRLEAAAPLPVQLCAAVFGWQSGDRLPLLGGLNEFASALLALQQLADWLTPGDMLGVVACIEATVPFRQPSADGQSVAAALLRRLNAANQRFALGCTPDRLDDCVTLAVTMANRDVAGFAEPDPSAFLANTWLLIEESNAALVAVGLYTVQDYRRALGRMQGFLSGLDPECIFHAHAGRPSSAEHGQLVAAARANLDFSRRYLACKLTAIALVEALALATGGDCPVSMMLGDIRASHQRPVRVEDHLPRVTPHADVDATLLAILAHGRRAESLRDLNNSPLTAFVYSVLGEAATLALFAEAQTMFAGDCTPQDFLRQVDARVLAPIVAACARIAVSRRAGLDSLRH